MPNTLVTVEEAERIINGHLALADWLYRRRQQRYPGAPGECDVMARVSCDYAKHARAMLREANLAQPVAIRLAAAAGAATTPAIGPDVVGEALIELVHRLGDNDQAVQTVANALQAAYGEALGQLLAKLWR